MFAQDSNITKPNERGEYEILDGMSATVFRAVLVGAALSLQRKLFASACLLSVLAARDTLASSVTSSAFFAAALLCRRLDVQCRKSSIGKLLFD